MHYFSRYGLPGSTSDSQWMWLSRPDWYSLKVCYLNNNNRTERAILTVEDPTVARRLQSIVPPSNCLRPRGALILSRKDSGSSTVACLSALAREKPSPAVLVLTPLGSHKEYEDLSPPPPCVPSTRPYRFGPA